jgi:hypothetical protein
MDIATLRGIKIQQALTQMETLFAANRGAGNLWCAQVRQAHSAVQLEIETLAEAGDAAALQGLDVVMHAAWADVVALAPASPPPPPAPPAGAEVVLDDVTYTITSADAAALTGAFLLVLQGQEVPVTLAGGQPLTVTGANATALAAALVQLQGG